MGEYCSFSPDLDHGLACRQHDADYMVGMTEWDRLKADWKLFVSIPSYYSIWIFPVALFGAFIYFLGVRYYGWMGFRYNNQTSFLGRHGWMWGFYIPAAIQTVIWLIPLVWYISFKVF